MHNGWTILPFVTKDVVHNQCFIWLNCSVLIVTRLYYIFGRVFRTSESESADFSEVRVRKFRTLKILRTRTQRVCLFTHLYSKDVNISQKKSEISIFSFLKSYYSQGHGSAYFYWFHDLFTMEALLTTVWGPSVRDNTNFQRLSFVYWNQKYWALAKPYYIALIIPFINHMHRYLL
jgi:hypothetical protein